MRVTFIFSFLFFTTLVFGQRIKNGKLELSHQGGGLYKIYLSQKPKNTTYPLIDSASYQITFICPSGSYEVRGFSISDTLWYYLESSTVVSSSAVWHRGGSVSYGQNPPRVIGESSWVGCFEETNAPIAPYESPQVEIIGGTIYSSQGGTLVVLQYPSLGVLELSTFTDPFSYSLPLGESYVYIIYPQEIIYLGVVVN